MPPAKKPAPRKDLGKPIDGFFAKQPPALKPITLALRGLIEEVVPDATSSIKWGMPFFEIESGMVCAIGAHKAHVNLILSGAPGTFDDPDGLLGGEGKTGQHIKFTSVESIPRAQVKRFLKQAVKNAKSGKGRM